MNRSNSMLAAVMGLAAGMSARDIGMSEPLIDMLMPPLGPTPNKYKPHQGRKEIERRKKVREKSNG